MKGLEVYVLTMIEIVATMNDRLDAMLLAIWKEHIAIKLVRVIEEYIGRITLTGVSVIDYRDEHIIVRLTERTTQEMTWLTSWPSCLS